MPKLTSQELADAVSEVGIDDIGDFKAVLVRAKVSPLKAALLEVEQALQARINEINGRVDTIRSRFDLAIREADAATNPTDIPTAVQIAAALA